MISHARRFGKYEISTVIDGTFEAALEVLTHERGASSLQDAITRFGEPKIQIVVNCFALRGPDGITLIDAGTDTSWGPSFGHARAALTNLGIAPDNVKRILLTHLHGDHALGLFDGGKPYFPSAEIYVPKTDLSYFTDQDAFEAAPAHRRGGFAIARQLQETYAGRIREIEPGEVLDGVDALALPGHTPGHTGYLLKDETSSLLIWGDTLHIAALQPADPDVGMIYDVDSAIGALTRRTTLDLAAAKGWIVAGSHIDGFGRVTRDGDGFRIDPA